MEFEGKYLESLLKTSLTYVVEDSLQREDVENMSRENMKNLHEIMQVELQKLLLQLKKRRAGPDKAGRVTQSVRAVFFNKRRTGPGRT